MTSGYFLVLHENCQSFDVCKITRTDGSLIIIPPPLPKTQNQWFFDDENFEEMKSQVFF